MGKKRSCRRTTDESIIHEKAVKMRKMTDEQLVHYVEDRVEKARSEGFNRGKEVKAETLQFTITDFAEEIGKIKGIGMVKNQRKALPNNLKQINGSFILTVFRQNHRK